MDRKDKFRLAVVLIGAFAVLFIGPLVVAGNHPELLGP